MLQKSQFKLPDYGDWWGVDIQVDAAACVLDFVLSDSAHRAWDNNGMKVSSSQCSDLIAYCAHRQLSTCAPLLATLLIAALLLHGQLSGLHLSCVPALCTSRADHSRG